MAGVCRKAYEEDSCSNSEDYKDDRVRNDGAHLSIASFAFNQQISLKVATPVQLSTC